MPPMTGAVGRPPCAQNRKIRLEKDLKKLHRWGEMKRQLERRPQGEQETGHRCQFKGEGHLEAEKRGQEEVQGACLLTNPWSSYDLYSLTFPGLQKKPNTAAGNVMPQMRPQSLSFTIGPAAASTASLTLVSAYLLRRHLYHFDGSCWSVWLLSRAAGDGTEGALRTSWEEGRSHG